MAFEESPSFDDLAEEPKEKKPFPAWLRRVLLLTVVSLLTILLLIGGSRLGSRAAAPVGGLDGCLVNEAGNPVVAEVSFGQQSKQTDEDGCFFFAALPIGTGRLIVHLDEEYIFPVEVINGQAVRLGDLVVE